MQLVLALLAAEVAVFAVSTLPGVRGGARLRPRCSTAGCRAPTYVTIAVLAALRPILVRADRRLWTWIAAALALRAAGFVVFLAYVREQQPPPYPSLADAGWIAMTIAAARRARPVRGRARQADDPRPWRSTRIVGALATAALALALLCGHARRPSRRPASRTTRW